jgi:hypothetical protein
MGQYLSFLEKLVDNNFSFREVNFIIESSYKIALHYLNQVNLKIQKIILVDEVPFEDIAIDAIAPLFTRNEQNEFYILKNTFRSWIPSVKTEEEALFLFNTIIANRVEQHITLLLKEADPFFAKIFESINYYFKKENLSKINYFGTVYIVENENLRINKNLIKPNDFDSLPGDLFINKKLLFKNILIFLKENTEYFPAIPINSLVHKIKKINAANFIVDELTENPTDLVELEELVSLGLDSAKDKLNNFYVSKGKLSNEEADFFTKALADMADDLKNGGIKHGLFEYLDPYSKQLSRADYQLKYQNIIEYLLKIMKKTISESLS